MGWQRTEILTRVWKIPGDWSVTKELACGPKAGTKGFSEGPLCPLQSPAPPRGGSPELNLPGAQQEPPGAGGLGRTPLVD